MGTPYLLRALALVGLLVVSGCGVQDAVIDEGEEFSTEDAPLLGADGRDAAERKCNVVLRSVERGATTCTSGLCWWNFNGVMDVSSAAVAEGAKPKVLFKNIDATTWTLVAGTKTSGAPAGFTRYKFKLSKNTIRDGMSATAYSRANVQLAPYLLTTSGARLFDHNRIGNELANYVVDQNGGWRVGEDAAVCMGDALEARALDFQNGWRIEQRGALVAGEAVTITYALDRLTTCRGTHNGFPAWDLRAFVRFAPSGAVVEGTVRGFDAPNGVPSNAGAKSVPFEVNVPSGTTSLEVWFKNSTGAGSSCEAWDSNLGANYRFAVSASAPARVEWVGNAGSSFSRACSRSDGVPATFAMDSYTQQRACAFVEVDVWAPGVTDSGDSGVGLFAQVESSRDGVVLPVKDLAFVGRVGNDWRFRFEVPKSELFYTPSPWSSFKYTLRFSSEGRAWKRDVKRVITRDSSFCNPAWGNGC